MRLTLDGGCACGGVVAVLAGCKVAVLAGCGGNVGKVVVGTDTVAVGNADVGGMDVEITAVGNGNKVGVGCANGLHAPILRANNIKMRKMQTVLNFVIDSCVSFQAKSQAQTAAPCT